MNQFKSNVLKHFSLAASEYSALACLQSKCAEHLIGLVESKTYSNALDIGCGTGFCIEYMQKTLNCIDITGVDIAPNMIKICNRKYPEHAFVCCDAESFIQNTKYKYQLIVSNFALQWFHDLQRFIINAIDVLTHNGTLAISLPVKGTLHELDGLQMHTLPEIDNIISILPNKFQHHVHEYLIYYPSALDAMRSLKKIGASYKGIGSNSISKIRSICNAYKNKEIHLTYKVLFLTVKKS